MVRQIAITQQQNQRAANHVKSELEYASDLDEWRIKNLLALVSLSHEGQELDFYKQVGGSEDDGRIKEKS